MPGTANNAGADLVPDFQALYVMRHGQTQDNVARIITGQADSQLTDLGREQASQKGDLLRRHVGNLDELKFISSPLHRSCVTLETARAAAGLDPGSYATDTRLMEMDFGEWTKRREGDDRYGPGQPSAHAQWDLQPPGGESQAQVYARVGEFLRSLGQDCVIACHARVLCMFRGHLLQLSPQETIAFKPSNAGFVQLSRGSERWFEEG